MQPSNPEAPSMPSPPAAIATLVKGFNSVASNPVVILLPVALDFFLWLGPRLKADSIITPILDAMTPDLQTQMPADQLQIFTQIMNDFRNGLNLFSVLRTFPLGVFSLMSSNLSTTSPLGTRLALTPADWATALLVMFALTLVGWLAGSLYFQATARAALKPQAGPGVLRTTLQSFLLSGSWMILFFMANLPILIVLGIIAMLDSVIRTILLILLSLPAAWILMAVYYSFFGIFTNGQNFFRSAISSFRMLRYGLPPLVWFTMLILLISQGMDMLWRGAPADSWMTGVGIFGHAFVSTSLLAASIIYYRDLTLWVESALQWLKRQNNSSAQA